MHFIIHIFIRNSEILDGVVGCILLEALSLKRVAIGFVFGDGLS